MELAGQPFDCAHGGSNRGYAMAALLVGMSVMAVLMGALLPVWTHMATREKEQELIFRGNQYARAIGLFQRKFANTPPPTIDVLVEQRFLRKKYKDPITDDDFQPIYANQAMLPGGPPSGPGGPQQSGQRGAPAAAGQRGTPGAPAGQVTQPGFNSTGATGAGGIIGVTSKSKDASIRILNGRQKYNEWAFVHVQTSQRPGQPGGGAAAPGFQGAPNQRPGPGQQGPGRQGQPNSPFGMPPGAFPQGPGGRGGPGQSPFDVRPPGGNSPFGTPQSPFGLPAPPTSPGGQRPPGKRPPGR